MEEKVSILIVDDEEVMRNLLCDILTDASYKAEAVSCGGEAIEKVQMAIVVDERKKAKGLVTLEDLIEETVGKIEEEYIKYPFK